MSNDIQIFEKPEFGTVRTTMIDNDPYFCLADVCHALELSNPSAVADQVKEEFETPNLKLGVFETTTGAKELVLVTEQQLYYVLMRSRSVNAKPFRQWLYNEVIPTIRKTGSYSTAPTVEQTVPPMLEHLQCLNYILDTWGIDKDEKVLAMGKFYKRETGVTLIEYVEAKEDEQCDHYEGVTEIAKKLTEVLGTKVSRNSMNPVLVSLGLQVATGNSHCRFDLTPKGKELGGRKEYVDPEHMVTSVANIKWMPGKLIPYLVEVFEKSPLIFSVK